MMLSKKPVLFHLTKKNGSCHFVEPALEQMVNKFWELDSFEKETVKLKMTLSVSEYLLTVINDQRRVNILLIMENATPRNSEYFLMKLGTVIRCSLKIK
jgi:hypothetical protein